MIADKQIYDLISDEYATTYFNKFPQSVNIESATPNVLIQNISRTGSKDKDHTERVECTYRIEVIGTIYLTVSNYAENIISVMRNYTDTYIYLIDFENRLYDTDSTSEIHRLILDFKVFINDPVTS